MATKNSNHRIREALGRLERLLDEPSSGRAHRRWTGALNHNLEQLEFALGEEASLKSQFFRQTARDHPRLLSTCAAFHEDGRVLLRQATVVVRLSLPSHEAGVTPLVELRKATAALIDAVKRHEYMASELTVEASHEIGGEG